MYVKYICSINLFIDKTLEKVKIGYARVSTVDQSLDLQLNALKDAGCETIYQEKVSGSFKDRPELRRMCEQLRLGDEVMVWRLDRLGRSLSDLIHLVNEFSEKSVSFSSISDKIDTTTSAGKLVFHIFCSLAEFEKELIKERTMAGLQAARMKGKIGGKPKGLTDNAKKTARVAESMHKEGYAVKQIGLQLGISRTTVYKYLEYRKNVTLS